MASPNQNPSLFKSSKESRDFANRSVGDVGALYDFTQGFDPRITRRNPLNGHYSNSCNTQQSRMDANSGMRQQGVIQGGRGVQGGLFLSYGSLPDSTPLLDPAQMNRAAAMTTSSASTNSADPPSLSARRQVTLPSPNITVTSSFPPAPSASVAPAPSTVVAPDSARELAEEEDSPRRRGVESQVDVEEGSMAQTRNAFNTSRFRDEIGSYRGPL